MACLTTAAVGRVALAADASLTVATATVVARVALAAGTSLTVTGTTIAADHSGQVLIIEDTQCLL